MVCSAVVKISCSFRPHHSRSRSTKTSGSKGEVLYIVIITEEETGRPTRCEMVAATDTEAPLASVIQGVGHTVSGPNGGWCKRAGLVRNTEHTQSGFCGRRHRPQKTTKWITESGRVCAVTQTARATCHALALGSWAWRRRGWSTLSANTHLSSPRYTLSIMHDASTRRGLADGRPSPAAHESLNLTPANVVRTREGANGPFPNGPFEGGLQFSQRKEFSWVREQKKKLGKIKKGLLGSLL